MVNFSDENGVETIKLLGDILSELQRLNESIATMDKNNKDNSNLIVEEIDRVVNAVYNID